MSKDRRLGRGLAALLGSPLDEQNLETPVETVSLPLRTEPRLFDDSVLQGSVTEVASTGDTGLLQLAVEEIQDNPFQPRREFNEEEIASLAESLKQHDLLQPILVRRIAGRYQLISGERRLRAAIRAGWKTIPARVREADDRLVAELAIVENLQRKDLNPIEKALSFKRYLDEHRCTQDELAKRLSIDRSTIANLMRLLELPPEVLESLRTGAISAGHARALLPLGDDDEQIALAHRITDEQLSVREVERLVNEQVAAEDDGHTATAPTAKKKRTRNDQIASLEQELRIALGTKVEIKQSAKGRGTVVIHFTDSDDFDRLRELLSDSAPRAKRAA
ncbi:putative chromosome-partitioning protein ParB [Anatilimnocola aggregata]|uniref:Putative chromosome-partitioning protein ParB n=1 Tax=Anatilimnocola aggregata TaxID=2528021 RepID=A0A517YKE2_9BACT|nr:ParB/RepB/Spo0J family partition protein [Anatilimnocola aggregata]QDU30693.1 putative chromosome-partitioning protein ParB [Anatilimnocola aggregata]